MGAGFERASSTVGAAVRYRRARMVFLCLPGERLWRRSALYCCMDQGCSSMCGGSATATAERSTVLRE